MKHNMKRTLPPVVSQLISRTRCLSAEIARAGKMDKAFVSRVLAGTRAPSARFLRAMGEVLRNQADRFISAGAAAEMAGLFCAHELEIAELKKGRSRRS